MVKFLSNFNRKKKIEEKKMKLEMDLSKNPEEKVNANLSEYGDFGSKPVLVNTKDARKNKGVQINEKAKQRASKSRYLTLRMYSYKIFNYLLKGSIDDRDPNLNGDSMQIGYSEVFTLSTVTRYYVISHLDEDTPVAFTNYLIKEVKTGKYWVNLSMQVKNKPYIVDFSASHLRIKLQTWARLLDEEVGEIEGKDGRKYTKDHDRSFFLKKTARMFRSYFKIRENVGYVKESTIILKLQTRDKKTMKLADKKLRSALGNMDVDYYQVTGSVLDFLRGFSPISKRHTVSNDLTNRILMTDRDLADMIPYRQGKIGDFGIWFGIDKYSGASVWLDLMNTPQAKNVLLMALTGAGKSFFMSMLLMFHKPLGHKIFIHDHKGNEFTHFTRANGGLIISMTPAKTCYLNTFIIPTEGVETEEELRGLFTESFSLSELVFMTITQPDPHEKKTYTNIFDDFMKHAHRYVGVIPDQVESYSKSKILQPEYLYALFDKFTGPESTAVIEAYGIKTLTEIKMALYRYWHPKGSRNELFKNEVNMEDIMESDVVCFDFGMAEQTRNSVPEHEEKLKKIFMNVAASRFTNNNKKNKKWTVKVVEEIQSADEDILAFTAADVTEGRAKNMFNYVLGNGTGTLSSGSRHADNIIQNMTIQILGELAEDAREFYIKQYGLQAMREDLENIANDSRYKYCFLLHCKITSPPVTAIVEAVTTPRVAESKFFKTVDFEQRD